MIMAMLKTMVISTKIGEKMKVPALLVVGSTDLLLAVMPELLSMFRLS